MDRKEKRRQEWSSQREGVWLWPEGFRRQCRRRWRRQPCGDHGDVTAPVWNTDTIDYNTLSIIRIGKIKVPANKCDVFQTDSVNLNELEKQCIVRLKPIILIMSIFNINWNWNWWHNYKLKNTFWVFPFKYSLRVMTPTYPPLKMTDHHRHKLIYLNISCMFNISSNSYRLIRNCRI